MAREWHGHSHEGPIRCDLGHHHHGQEVVKVLLSTPPHFTAQPITTTEVPRLGDGGWLTSNKAIRRWESLSHGDSIVGPPMDLLQSTMGILQDVDVTGLPLFRYSLRQAMRGVKVAPLLLIVEASYGRNRSILLYWSSRDPC